MENFPVNLTYEAVKTPRVAWLVCRTLTVCIWGCAQIKAADAYEHTVKPFLENYCAVCHDKQARAGGLDITPLLKLSAKQASSEKKTWGQIYEKVSSGEMPKKGALLPTGEEIAPVLAWIASQLEH